MLTELKMECCKIKMNYLIKHCIQLQTISIIYTLVDNPPSATNNILQHISTITTLKMLNLRGNKLTEEAVESLVSIISNNMRLEELCLGDNLLKQGVTN